ncbi:LysM peptidoglycan-binding domain-containing protein [Treponema sp. OMZ 840]|uniref:LysM peptidoglycan-binding domain-containing protein n=1 Tax=Treponema sp. OMZ 840 TaxID=244313 RepID=UPI003D90BE65
MSNKIIGIKQADGSFYPILQDGKADNKMLELTTVRDGQTTVQVNLYKKEMDSIDEPVYVDTLLIENLIPHPKEEPTIHLDINLDEDNVLTAKAVDPETGNSSDIRVSLITLPEAALAAVPDFTVTDAESFIQKEGEAALADDTIENAENADDFSADTAQLNAADMNTMSFDMPDFDEADAFSVNTAEKTEKIQETDTQIEDIPDFNTDESDDFDMSVPDENESAKADSDNFDFDSLGDTQNANTDAEKNESDASISSFDMPDFDEKDSFSSSNTEDEFSLYDETADQHEISLNIDPDKEEDTSPGGFDMPDFDAEDFSSDTQETAESNQNDFSASDTAFDPPLFDAKDDTVHTDADMHTRTKDQPPLYDLNLPDEIDESDRKKKCRIPMLICIICAILCILAVIGIFLRFPWKKQQDTAAKDTHIVTVEPPENKPQAENTAPPVPEENTIVIVEKETVEKKEVVPEKTVPAPETKPQAVRYLIKWGDTLWDLSDTYYRNPWLYPIIARENKIKNPDLIIAGTYIIIPPR